MTSELLYHGASGDKILGIIESGEMRPGTDGRIFFARDDWSSVFQHGGDLKRRAAFAIKLRASMPKGVALHRGATPGVPNTLVVLTTSPLHVTVQELFVRERPGAPVVRIVGTEAIVHYLRSRQGPAGA